MRRVFAACTVAAALVTSGCWQVSIHPFFSDTLPLEEVAGHWVSEGDKPEALEFAAARGKTWTVKYTESDGAQSLGRIRFGRVGESLYWDMTTDVPESAGDLATLHLLPLHSVARVALQGDRMETAVLDPAWIARAVADGLVDLAHLHPDGDDPDSAVVLTATTAELTAFLRSYGEVPEAFGEPTVYHRKREAPSTMGRVSQD